MLTIYDGSNTSSPILASLTGTPPLASYTTTGTMMLLSFQSNSAGTSSGFAAALSFASSTYDMVTACPGPGYVFVSGGVTTIEVSSTSMYANNLYCAVVIESPSSLPVQVWTC